MSFMSLCRSLTLPVPRMLLFLLWYHEVLALYLKVHQVKFHIAAELGKPIIFLLPISLEQKPFFNQNSPEQ